MKLGAGSAFVDMPLFVLFLPRSMLAGFTTGQDKNQCQYGQPKRYVFSADHYGSGIYYY